MSVLVIGYGNPGRRDDGLGPAFAERLAARDLPGVTVESDYQLAVEDALDVAAHDVVVFVDAAAAGPSPFSFREVAPAREISFTTHHVPPGAVLALAERHFSGTARGFVLAIRGADFDGFGEGLTPEAERHLEAALDHLEDRIRNGRLDPCGTAGA